MKMVCDLNKLLYPKVKDRLREDIPISQETGWEAVAVIQAGEDVARARTGVNA